MNVHLTTWSKEANLISVMNIHSIKERVMASHWTPEDIPDQTGRTALITGANSGIGLETGRVLAAHGARIIVAGRDQARLDEAVRVIRAAGPRADHETLVLDLADLASVRAAAKQVVDGGAV